MSSAEILEIKDEITFPPAEIDSNEPPVETDLHLRQIFLLLSCLEWYWREKNDFFASGNLTIYYSPHQKKSEYFRGPDFFVVKNTERRTRRSWVVWEEKGKYPDVIIEILSESTAQTDREEKKQIYQDIFRTPNYFWFEPYTLELAGFSLSKGKYEEITANEQGWLYSEQLDLYLGIHAGKLRYFTPQGKLVLTPEEEATQAKLEKQIAVQQRELARQKVRELEQKLRKLGIDPNSI